MSPMPPPPAAPVAPYLVSVSRVTLDGSNTSGASFLLENLTTGGSVPAIISNEADSNIIIDLADASGDVWEIGDSIKITATKSGYSQATAPHTIASGDNGMWDFGTISISTWSGSTVTELSTHQKKLYMPYELYHDIQNTATSPNITVTGKKPHADVIASSGHKLKRTRVYINGVRATITEVALSTNDTVISVSDTIVSGDNVHIFLAATVGTLANNTTVGKFPFAKLQVAQKYSVASNTNKQSGCGSTRIHRISYVGKGAATLAFIRHGNTNMKNFILAAKNSKFLMFIIKDTTDAANTTYEVLHECRVQNCTRGTQATNAKGSEIADVISLTFVPDVSPTT